VISSTLRSRSGRIALGLFVAAGLILPEALAWGPVARRSIALAALQLVQRAAPDAFRAGRISYESDMLRGVDDGIQVLGDIPLNTENQAIDAVYAEIHVLREARKNGQGSYFAYRMGGLAALTAEITMPYGIPKNESEMVLADRIDEDLERHLERMTFNPRHEVFHYIRDPRTYFDTRRSFYAADKQMIKDDYQRGRAYRGLLAEAGSKYFRQSVGAVTDVWYTALRPEGSPSDRQPSPRQMALYYIGEVEYQLLVKKNFDVALRAYDLFENYNPGMPMAYIQLGDLFYEFGTPEGRDRGVQEWKIAQRVPGQPRKAASQRLAKHFIEEGERLFRRAQSPSALETDLRDALKAFSTALEFDLRNDVAARRITETTLAINERENQRELQQRFIENAAAIAQAAERSVLDEDFAGAITSYNQALMLLQNVTPDFKDLNETARDQASQINKNLKNVVRNVFAAANDAIERGDAALLNNNFDEAIRFYSTVESIVDVVPAEEGSINAQQKQDLIQTAQTHIDDAELQRERQRARQQQQQQQTNPLQGLGNN